MPKVETLQEHLSLIDTERTDLAEFMTLFFSRILKVTQFNSTDVERMSQNLEPFKRENLSQEDIAILQNVVEELREDNTLENAYKVVHDLPIEKEYLSDLAGYLHWHMIFAS